MKNNLFTIHIAYTSVLQYYFMILDIQSYFDEYFIFVILFKDWLGKMIYDLILLPTQILTQITTIDY